MGGGRVLLFPVSCFLSAGGVDGPGLLPAGFRPEVLELDGQFEGVAPAEADRAADRADPPVLGGAEGQADAEARGRQRAFLELDLRQQRAAKTDVADDGAALG